MPPTIHPDPPPLRVEGDTIRVGTSRLTLDQVLREYQDGATPEEIARAYDTVGVADAYGAIAYYLRHKEEVDDYLAQRDQEAAALRREIEAACGTGEGRRAKLEARRAQAEGADGA